MSAKRMRPSRNSATAASFAALNTAGAAPPVRPAATPSANAGNCSARTGSNVSGDSATGSNGGTPVSGTRSGCVSAYSTGSSMLGTPSCASTLPSTNSTNECTTLCGCTTTSMRSYGNAEQKVRLDHLERLVRQRRAVDGDLASHLPGGMPQRVVERRGLELLRRPLPKRAARRRDDHAPHLDARPAGDALENRAVLAVDGNDLAAAALRTLPRRARRP